jgi:uncharacterized protein
MNVFSSSIVLALLLPQPNRLALETSPYLRQHADNPADWRPWGDDAFEAARALGRPVLLSIGYSTCHWCHVMAEESFEDEEIARVMNDHYVAIKVDREERPDVDAAYLAAVRRLTGGGGGWPMTVWLTADRKPFFGGTYFPARDGERGIGTGFLTLLKRVHAEYTANPARFAETSEKLARTLQDTLVPAPTQRPLKALALNSATKRFAALFDAQNGGMIGAPKSPATCRSGSSSGSITEPATRRP